MTTDDVIHCTVTGDIGGSMGLFIGASALTIFELLDVFAYVLFRKAAPKPATKHRPAR